MPDCQTKRPPSPFLLIDAQRLERIVLEAVQPLVVPNSTRARVSRKLHETFFDN